MKKNKQKFVLGEKVFITERAKVMVGIDNDYEYEIMDILKIKVNSPYVLVCEELGSGWMEFFSKDELIKINKEVV
jgi:hypothetical protein